MQADLTSDALLQLDRFNELVQKYVNSGLIPPAEGTALIKEAESITSFIESSIEVASERSSSDTPAFLKANLPGAFELQQNHPNPFNGSTSIRFTLPSHSQARLSVYDVLGREVKQVFNDSMEAGTYTIDFDASELPSGTYLYHLETPTGTKSRLMVVL